MVWYYMIKGLSRVVVADAAPVARFGMCTCISAGPGTCTRTLQRTWEFWSPPNASPFRAGINLLYIRKLESSIRASKSTFQNQTIWYWREVVKGRRTLENQSARAPQGFAMPRNEKPFAYPDSPNSSPPGNKIPKPNSLIFTFNKYSTC